MGIGASEAVSHRAATVRLVHGHAFYQYDATLYDSRQVWFLQHLLDYQSS